MHANNIILTSNCDVTSGGLAKMRQEVTLSHVQDKESHDIATISSHLYTVAVV